MMYKLRGIIREEEPDDGGIGGGGAPDGVAPPQGGGIGGGGTPAPEPTSATDFMSEDTYKAFVQSLPEDQRELPLLQQTKNLPSLLKQTIDAQSALGSKRLAVPQEDWSDDQWKEFHTQAGRPETRDGYSFEEKIDIKLGDQQDIRTYEMAPETADALRDVADAMDLTPRQAKILAEKWAEQDILATDYLQGDTDKSVEEHQNQLKIDWGHEYEIKHRAANEAYEALAEEIPELRDLMAWSPQVANHLATMKLFERLSPLLQEAGLRGKSAIPSGSFGEASVAGLKADIQSLRSDNAELINTNPSSLSMADRAKREGVLDQITELYKKLHPSG